MVGRFDERFLEEIKSRLRPSDLIGRTVKLRKQGRDVVDLFTKSAGEILDRRFESAPIKAAFGFDAVVGNFASPYAPGSSQAAAAACSATEAAMEPASARTRLYSYSRYQ